MLRGNTSSQVLTPTWRRILKSERRAPAQRKIRMRKMTMAHGELVEMEASLDDQSEQAKIEQLLRDSCSCQLGPYGGPCSSAVSKEAIVPCQNNCLQMARKEFNLAVMAQSYALSTPVVGISST